MSSEFSVILSRKYNVNETLTFFEEVGVNVFEQERKIKTFTIEGAQLLFLYVTRAQFIDNFNTNLNVKFELTYQEAQFSCYINYEHSLQYFSENYNLSNLNRSEYTEVSNLLQNKAILQRQLFDVEGMLAASYDNQIDPVDLFLSESPNLITVDSQYITHLICKKEKLNFISDELICNKAKSLDDTYDVYSR